MAGEKVEICLKKKPTPSTNIPSLSKVCDLRSKTRLLVFKGKFPNVSTAFWGQFKSFVIRNNLNKKFFLLLSIYSLWRDANFKDLCLLSRIQKKSKWFASVQFGTH